MVLWKLMLLRHDTEDLTITWFWSSYILDIYHQEIQIGFMLLELDSHLQQVGSNNNEGSIRFMDS